LKVYLDIETSFSGKITVVGIYKPGKGFFQFFGNEVSAENIEKTIKNSNTIFTYNGSRFDLPVIKKELKLNLSSKCHSHDLMYDCWNVNLYGGLKEVEKTLGIRRDLKEISGYDAMILWERYKLNGDKKALSVLLEYNKEDVLNLPVLESKLLSCCKFENVPVAYDV
jgi:uncharacterized protein YprB with RNaseH-like and TPR domain